MARRNKKRVLIEVKCATCGEPLLRTKSAVEVNNQFFCNRTCKHKGQTLALGISGWARMKKEKEGGGDGVKLRPCLGWCGKMIKTTASVRFCEACTSRKNFAAVGIDEFEHEISFENK